MAALCAVAVLAGIAVTGRADGSKSPDSAGRDAVSRDAAYQRNLVILASIADAIEENYVDTIDIDRAFNAAVEGMLSTIDPYTNYFPYDDKETLQKMTTGEYGGIGSFVTGRGNATYIREPLMGSPAMKAGLLPGDKILYVDSVYAVGKTTDQTTSLLKGTAGTEVRVTVSRPYVGADSIRTFTLTRERVSEPSVPWHGVIGGNTGYVALNAFVESSADDVHSALEELKANPEVKQMVLDLRGNGGGLMESAIDILGNFLPKGTEVLRTKGRGASEERTYKTRRNPILPDMPLVVLIDGGSASAAEITAGALQDLDRAVLIGSNSYGKGLVQGTRPLPYNGLLKVTTAKYYIPSGRLIQALDYSRRNADGSVARTPDSLTNVYRTAHGREVRDGGGLRPDSTIVWESPSPLLYGLMVENHFFDFANKYVAEHPEPRASAADFKLTDGEFESFTQSIDPKGFKYDKLCNQIIDNLREAIKAEGYGNEEVTAQLASLEKALAHDLRGDLYAKRPMVEKYLTEEIVSRYYPGYGRARAELNGDPAMEKAMEIFNTPGLYRKILNLDQKKR